MLSLDSPFRLCVVPEVEAVEAVEAVRSEGPPFAPVTGFAPEGVVVGVGAGVGVGLGLEPGLEGSLANAAVTVSTRSTPFDLATSQIITIATPMTKAAISTPKPKADSEPIFLF